MFVYAQVQVLSSVRQLEQLEQQLALASSSPSSSDHNHSNSSTISEEIAIASIKPGLVCVANSSIDKRWYRALVISEVFSCSREMASESRAEGIHVSVVSGGVLTLHVYTCMLGFPQIE